MKAQVLFFFVLLALLQPAMAQDASHAEAQAAADSQEAALQASLTDGTTNLSSPKEAPAKVAPLYEASCKIKAKEAAAQIFRSCMTDGKNAQLEQIRKEYQQKLGAMRAEYEKELTRLSKIKKENSSEAKFKVDGKDQSENKINSENKSRSENKEDSQTESSMRIELKPDTKSSKVESRTSKKDSKAELKSASKTKAAAKSQKPSLSAQKFTKKGLPLKTVKSNLIEMANGKTEDQVMTISLKPASSVEFKESQEVPEPIAIEKLDSSANSQERESEIKPEVKPEFKPEIKASTATIQLD